jgi:chemotaxis protein methyltransferase CheR
MDSLLKPLMKPEDFRLIKEFIAETFGLVLDEGKENYLALKLLPRIEELRLSTFVEYYSYLKFSPHSEEEHLKFISLITNNETYFFREEAQLKVFADTILPALKERKLKSGNRTIRIISAGCSTGEEVYTLAMLILESGSFVWDWDVKIVGIDVDRQAIETAKTGVYSGRAFHSTTDYYRERYFTKGEHGLKVRDFLRRLTSFVQGNLLCFDRALAELNVDIIFCRNVLIYFNDDTIRRIVESFERVLASDGFLFLGHSESLSRITSRYLPLRFTGAIVYRLKERNG